MTDSLPSLPVDSPPSTTNSSCLPLLLPLPTSRPDCKHRPRCTRDLQPYHRSLVPPGSKAAPASTQVSHLRLLPGSASSRLDPLRRPLPASLLLTNLPWAILPLQSQVHKKASQARPLLHNNYKWLDQARRSALYLCRALTTLWHPKSLLRQTHLRAAWRPRKVRSKAV